MAYATVAQLRDYAGIEDDRHDALLALFIARAQVVIDRHVGFSFEASADSTRYFDSSDTRKGGHVDGRLLLFDTWCSSITSVTNGDATVITSAYYVTEPRNGSRYYGIRLLTSSGYTWEAKSTTDDVEKAITIVGKWAYSTTAPADITHAALRLALWYYRQRDSSTDLDRPMLAEGVTILPSQVPADVLAILDSYRWRTV
jgi:hypothetical protein